MFRFLVARHAQCWILISNSRSQLKGYVTVMLMLVALGWSDDSP
jgi:hypothetical protein